MGGRGIDVEISFEALCSKREEKIGKLPESW